MDAETGTGFCEATVSLMIFIAVSGPRLGVEASMSLATRSKGCCCKGEKQNDKK